jgi:hypothetical protein
MHPHSIAPRERVPVLDRGLTGAGRFVPDASPREQSGPITFPRALYCLIGANCPLAVSAYRS